MDIQTALITAV